MSKPRQSAVSPRALRLFPFLLFACVLLGSAGRAAAQETCHWSYEGPTGPEHWGEVCGDCLCSNGTRQSPIDLTGAEPAGLPALEFRYRTTPLVVQNNGHTIKVPWRPGSFLLIGSERYQLLELHFHTPSEHTVNGATRPLEAHLVHANATGDLAVVGVFLTEARAGNSTVAAIWPHLPDEEGVIQVPGQRVSAGGLLPAPRGYFRYGGSLTTPPCGEGVRWHVLRNPVAITSAEIARFREIFAHNARPVQPLDGRKVLRGPF